MKLEGLPVYDAERPAHITITAGDVKRGGVKKPSSCAAALACLRDLKVTEARVHLGRTYLRKGDKWLRYATPASLRTEIVAFDRGGSFTPDDYTLTPMSPSNLLGHSKPTGPKRTKTKRKVRAFHTVVGVRPRATRGERK